MRLFSSKLLYWNSSNCLFRKSLSLSNSLRSLAPNTSNPTLFMALNKFSFMNSKQSFISLAWHSVKLSFCISLFRLVSHVLSFFFSRLDSHCLCALSQLLDLFGVNLPVSRNSSKLFDNLLDLGSVIELFFLVPVESSDDERWQCAAES